VFVLYRRHTLHNIASLFNFKYRNVPKEM